MTGDAIAFATSFERLHATVEAACRRRREWPSGVLAGIEAAARFVVSDPVAAHQLAAGTGAPENDGRQRLIGRFSALLQEGAPGDRRLPAPTDEALVGGIVTVFDGHLRAGREEQLLELAPELACFALLPYLGIDEAKRWTESGA